MVLLNDWILYRVWRTEQLYAFALSQDARVTRCSPALSRELCQHIARFIDHTVDEIHQIAEKIRSGEYEIIRNRH